MSFHGLYDIPHTCRICKKQGSSLLRADWGCDVPTTQPQFFIPCVRCDGSDSECELCKGEGFEAIHECPYRSGLGPAAELLELHKTWPGTLPLAGGLFDQPALYLDCMRFLDQAIARVTVELRKREELKNARPGA